ncbi:MAG: hypothetical protein KC619_00480 [Myxococcales bacterium]|nr:hypothetical protein [Myxococcales bacterium]
MQRFVTGIVLVLSSVGLGVVAGCGSPEDTGCDYRVTPTSLLLGPGESMSFLLTEAPAGVGATDVTVTPGPGAVTPSLEDTPDGIRATVSCPADPTPGVFQVTFAIGGCPTTVTYECSREPLSGGCPDDGTYDAAFTFTLREEACGQRSYAAEGAMVFAAPRVEIDFGGVPVVGSLAGEECHATLSSTDGEDYDLTCSPSRCTGTVRNVSTADGCVSIFDVDVALSPRETAVTLEDLDCGVQAAIGPRLGGRLRGVEVLGDRYLAVLTDRTLYVVNREDGAPVGQVDLPPEAGDAPSMINYGIGSGIETPLDGGILITPEGRTDSSTPIIELDASDPANPTLRVTQWLEPSRSPGWMGIAPAVDGTAFVAVGDATGTTFAPLTRTGGITTVGEPVDTSFGAPHFTTFDGVSLTFGGWGDFELVLSGVEPTTGVVDWTASFALDEAPGTVTSSDGLLFVGSSGRTTAEALLFRGGAGAAPTLAARFTRPTGPIHQARFYAPDRLALLAGSTLRSAVFTIDVTDPTHPVELGSATFGGLPSGLAVLPDGRFVVAESATLLYFDLSACPP